jgi:hypothetical protein
MCLTINKFSVLITKLGQHTTSTLINMKVIAEYDSTYSVAKHWWELLCLSQTYPWSDQAEHHFKHESESPWPLHFKHSHWWKQWSRSKFASQYPWRTNGVSECQMDVKPAWIPTWHQMHRVSWSLGLFSKTTSWRSCPPNTHNRSFITFHHFTHI